MPSALCKGLVTVNKGEKLNPDKQQQQSSFQHSRGMNGLQIPPQAYPMNDPRYCKLDGILYHL